MAQYSLRGPNGRFVCVPSYPRKRKSRCGCALGGNHPCPIHRPSRTTAAKISTAPERKVRLDRELREEYQDHWLELDAERTGLEAEVGQIKDEIASDVYDRGRRIDYRHVPKTRVHQVSPTGRRLSVRPEVAFDSAIREARGRLSTAQARLRDVKAEIKEVERDLKRGYLIRPAGYVSPLAGAARRRPLGARRTRAGRSPQRVSDGFAVIHRGRWITVRHVSRDYLYGWHGIVDGRIVSRASTGILALAWAKQAIDRGQARRRSRGMWRR